jgi:hypothetical protein
LARIRQEYAEFATNPGSSLTSEASLQTSTHEQFTRFLTQTEIRRLLDSLPQEILLSFEVGQTQSFFKCGAGFRGLA